MYGSPLFSNTCMHRFTLALSWGETPTCNWCFHLDNIISNRADNYLQDELLFSYSRYAACTMRVIFFLIFSASNCYSHKTLHRPINMANSSLQDVRDSLTCRGRLGMALSVISICVLSHAPREMNIRALFNAVRRFVARGRRGNLICVYIYTQRRTWMILLKMSYLLMYSSLCIDAYV